MRQIDKIKARLTEARRPLTTREIAAETNLTPGQVSKVMHAYADSHDIVRSSTSTRESAWSMASVLPPPEAHENPEDLDTVREWRASQAAENTKPSRLTTRLVTAVKLMGIAFSVLKGDIK